MEIIKTTVMPDGTRIQLEDWRKDYPTTEKTTLLVHILFVKMPLVI